MLVPNDIPGIAQCRPEISELALSWLLWPKLSGKRGSGESAVRLQRESSDDFCRPRRAESRDLIARGSNTEIAKHLDSNGAWHLNRRLPRAEAKLGLNGIESRESKTSVGKKRREKMVRPPACVYGLNSRWVIYVSITLSQTLMPQFLIAIHHRDDYDPSTEPASMAQAIDDLNDEMVAAGIRVFVGGLHHASTARSILRNEGGELEVREGSYLQTDSHVGGFWVLKCADMDEAISWGQKAAIACQAPVEVRQFH